MTSTRSTAELYAILNARSRAVAYELVQPLGHVLTVARDALDGDLDKALIMLVVTLRSSRHPAFRNLDDEQIDDREVLPGFGCNMRSIADSTGVPKETVRRKVQQLIDQGWVVRSGRNLCYSVEGYRALAPARESIIRMYVQGCQVIAAEERAAAKRARS